MKQGGEDISHHVSYSAMMVVNCLLPQTVFLEYTTLLFLTGTFTMPFHDFIAGGKGRKCSLADGPGWG
jgi:hypothetical protein